MIKKTNVVFEGGGVKGIGLVGAVAALENAGYSFDGIAGTSAGAIIAALLASGYTAHEMKAVMEETDYSKFKQKDFLDRLGLPGKALSIFKNYGIYSSDYFERWLETLLIKKGVRVFGDIKNKPGALKKYKFQAIASDITSKRMLILPDDLSLFGCPADGFSIAKAVRMSMSIPVFFEPVSINDKAGKRHLIVDGGLLSNYPMWLFDNAEKASFTIGIRFRKGIQSGGKILSKNNVNNFTDYLKCIIDTMLEAHDKQHIHTSNGDFDKTVFISPSVQSNNELKDIKSTYFEITRNEAEALYQNGKAAAERFLRLQ